jgi:hypothetical protein
MIYLCTSWQTPPDAARWAPRIADLAQLPAWLQLTLLAAAASPVEMAPPMLSIVPQQTRDPAIATAYQDWLTVAQASPDPTVARLAIATADHSPEARHRLLAVVRRHGRPLRDAAWEPTLRAAAIALDYVYPTVAASGLVYAAKERAEIDGAMAQLPPRPGGPPCGNGVALMVRQRLFENDRRVALGWALISRARPSDLAQRMRDTQRAVDALLVEPAHAR